MSHRVRCATATDNPIPSDPNLSLFTCEPVRLISLLYFLPASLSIFSSFSWSSPFLFLLFFPGPPFLVAGPNRGQAWLLYLLLPHFFTPPSLCFSLSPMPPWLPHNLSPLDSTWGSGGSLRRNLKGTTLQTKISYKLATKKKLNLSLGNS